MPQNHETTTVVRVAVFETKPRILCKTYPRERKYNSRRSVTFSDGPISRGSAQCRSEGDTSTKVSLEPLSLNAQRLLRASLAENTWKMYRKAVNYFIEFRVKWDLSSVWPVGSMDIMAFI